MFLPSQIYDGVLVLESTESEEKKVKSLSRVQIFATSQIVACQALLSMEFSRQEYWSRLSFPASGDLADTGIKPTSPEFAGRFFTTESPWKPIVSM